MAVTVAKFRQDFSEFANVTAFPASTIQFWLTVADSFLDKNRWGRNRDIGIELFTAHNVAIEAQARRIAIAGGIPGINTGVVSEKHVGPAGVSYDSQAAILPGAGHWNLTVYGTRLMWMVDMFGAGPVQIGVGYTPPFVGGSYGAWVGPPPWPLPSGTGFSS